MGLIAISAFILVMFVLERCFSNIIESLLALGLIAAFVVNCFLIGEAIILALTK